MSTIKFCFIVCLVFLVTTSLVAQELKLEEVVSKHTSAIAKPEKRKELKNMMLIGTSEFASKMPERKAFGKVAIISDASNLMFISNFASDGYPFEKIGNFNGKLDIPFVNQGVRSPLGDFLWEHPSILKNGLFSGSMTLQWSFLERDLKKGKISLSGTKKIDGRKAYMVEDFSGDVKVRLYFDAENFQHIRTEYREEYTGKQPTFGVLGKNLPGYVFELTETFSEFKDYEGIVLPSVSKVRYQASTSKGVYEYDWSFKISDVRFNQSLEAGFFSF